MDAFAQLRQDAAYKLIEAIRAARKEHEETLHRIKSLEIELGYKPVKKPKAAQTLFESIMQIVPHDRTFTVHEIIETLEVVEPERQAKRNTVKTTMHRLADRGKLRRVGKDRKTNCVFWATMDCPAEVDPFAAKPLSDVLYQILKDAPGPMFPPELVMAVQAIGYRVDDDSQKVLTAVHGSLRGNPRRFSKGGDGRWGLVCR